MRVLHFHITVGNVISEPTILCVILSSREETMYVCNSKLDYVVQPMWAFSLRLTCMGTNMNIPS